MRSCRIHEIMPSSLGAKKKERNRSMYVKGVNLGNWLVLEKWMSPGLFAGTTAEDEYYLPAQLPPEVYEARIKTHRSEYITERDFAAIKNIGLNAPLAEKSVITPEDLQGQRLIMTKRKSVQNELENWLGKYYDQIKVVATSNLSYYNRSMMVKNNLGIATCHEFQNAYEELCLRTLEPEISNGSVLIWKKAQVFSPAVIKFIEFVRNLL